MVQQWAEYLVIARKVASEATALLATAHEAEKEIRTKSTVFDLVTEWDTKSEELIRSRLSELSPGIPILAEEGGVSGTAGADLCWVVDPIDGTVNFAHGLPFFSVTVALELKHQPVVGVVVAPALGWEFYATLGGGAFHDGGRAKVSTIAALESAALATGFPYDRATSGTNFTEWEHFQRRAGACRRFGAASLDLCMVARGWLDGYWESELSPWDVTAGALIVAEAGGRVTNLSGGEFESAVGQALATNGLLHDTMLEELAAARSDR